MTDIANWAATASGNNTGAPPDYPTEGMAPSSVNDTMREIMAAVRRFVLDINGSVTTGGTGNAFTFTTNQTVSSYVAGQIFTFTANRANTAAATLNVNSIGAVNIEKADGSSLSAGEIASGGVYTVIYDGTQFQIQNGVPASGAFTSSGTVDLTDSDAPLVIAAGTGQHLELDGDDIQSKSDATTASTLNLNKLGGNVRAGAQSGTGRVELWHNGAIGAQTAADGLNVRHGSAATPVVRLQNSSGTELAQVLFSTNFIFRSSVASALIVLDGLNSGSSVTRVFEGDPDGAATLKYQGTNRVSSSAAGGVVSGTQLDLDNSGASTLTEIQARNSAGGIQLTVTATTGNGQISQTAGDGIVEDVWINLTRNGAVSLYHNNIAILDTDAGGIVVNGTAVVDAPTADDEAATKGYVDSADDDSNLASFADADVQATDLVGVYNASAGAMQAALPRQLVSPFRIVTADTTLALTDGNATVALSGSNDRTITVPPNSSVAFPINTNIELLCPDTARITVAPGSGVTINQPDSLTVIRAGGMAVLKKVRTDQWMLLGSLE